MTIKDYIYNPRLSENFNYRIGIVERAFGNYSRDNHPYFRNHVNAIQSDISHTIKNIDDLISDLDEEIKEQSGLKPESSIQQ